MHVAEKLESRSKKTLRDPIVTLFIASPTAPDFSCRCAPCISRIVCSHRSAMRTRKVVTPVSPLAGAIKTSAPDGLLAPSGA